MQNSDKIITDSEVPLNSMELYTIFQPIVLVLQPSTLLFWFILTALISVVSSHSGLFVHYLPSAKLQTDKVSNQLVIFHSRLTRD